MRAKNGFDSDKLSFDEIEREIGRVAWNSQYRIYVDAEHPGSFEEFYDEAIGAKVWIMSRAGAQHFHAECPIALAEEIDPMRGRYEMLIDGDTIPRLELPPFRDVVSIASA